MAITTYAELKTTIATWLKRSDLTSEIVDFVTLGEARLNRRLRLLQQETSASVTLSSGARTATLPTGFIEPISLVHDSDEYPLRQQSWGDLVNLSEASATGRPNLYAIGSSITFERTADQAYALTMRYFQKWDIATDTANWLLTNSPDAYLYSALLEAKAFTQKPSDAVLWAQALDQSITELNRLDGRTRSQSAARVDGALSETRRFNINWGY